MRAPPGDQLGCSARDLTASARVCPDFTFTTDSPSAPPPTSVGYSKPICETTIDSPSGDQAGENPNSVRRVTDSPWCRFDTRKIGNLAERGDLRFSGLTGRPIRQITAGETRANDANHERAHPERRPWTRTKRPRDSLTDPCDDLPARCRRRTGKRTQRECEIVGGLKSARRFLFEAVFDDLLYAAGHRRKQRRWIALQDCA